MSALDGLYGTRLDRRQIGRKFGCLDQFAGIREYELRRGKAKGMTVLDVRNGSGLRFTVLPDRGLDIGDAELNGRPMAWLSRNGLVAPQFMETTELGFLRSFSGGLVTTCGLTNVGLSERDQEGDYLPFHGRIAHTPAESWSGEDRWDGDRLVMQIRGRVRECRVYAENLVLERTITTVLGQNTIRIDDIVRNEGNRSWPLMLFYHINFGFPLIGDASRYITRATDVWALNEAAQSGDGRHEILAAEEDQYPFQCFVHEMPRDGRQTYAAIVNDELGLAAGLEYDPSELPFFNQWKVMEMQDYVAAFEPGNCMPEGRSTASANHRLQCIEPGAEYKSTVCIMFTDDAAEVRRLGETTEQPASAGKIKKGRTA